MRRTVLRSPLKRVSPPWADITRDCRQKHPTLENLTREFSGREPARQRSRATSNVCGTQEKRERESEETWHTCKG